MTTPKQIQSQFLWLRAETFVHVGTNQTASLIDLPIAREAGTDYPYIPGSGMKGALRDTARLRYEPDVREEQFEKDHKLVRTMFGAEAGTGAAGQLLVSDARLAFLPLRSLDRAFVWATCPHILDRLARDLCFAGEQVPNEFAISSPNDGHATCADGESRGKDQPSNGNRQQDQRNEPGRPEKIFIEEFSFAKSSSASAWNDLRPLLALLAPNDQNAIRQRLVILRDEDFAYFCRRSVHVRMRNALDPATKTVKGSSLWSEESLPPETLLYVVVTPRSLVEAKSACDDFLDAMRHARNYIQVGGNETVGEGWLKILNESYVLGSTAVTGTSKEAADAKS